MLPRITKRSFRSMSSKGLSRGDIVIYLNEPYYFQPNGRYCYLYLHKEDIGKPKSAEWSPSILSIKLAPQGVIPKRKRILQIYNPENDPTEKNCFSCERF